MDVAAAVDLAQKTLLTALAVAAPLLVSVLILALLLAILTTIFNLQEQTLTVVPKIVAAFLLAFFLTPWILRQLVDFTVPLLRDALARGG